jgi:hypothetical protein
MISIDQTTGLRLSTLGESLSHGGINVYTATSGVLAGNKKPRMLMICEVFEVLSVQVYTINERSK